VPGATPELAVRVTVAVPLPGAAMLAGEKSTPICAGSPLTESATAELNPALAVVVSAICAGAPGATLAVAKPRTSVKVAGATFAGTSTVRLYPPPEPVTTTGHAPVAAPAAAWSVMFTAAAVVMVGEERLTETAGHALAAVRFTGDANPPCVVSATGAITEAPAVMPEAGACAEREKLEVALLAQLLTSTKASTEPRPVVMS
jgi:hypothetical protein